MTRYDDPYDRNDRHGHNTKLYVGRLSPCTRIKDLEYLFSRYGRVRYVDLKYDYGFVEFSDPRDANDARLDLDGREFGGSYIIVHFARGVKRGPGGSCEYTARRSPHGSDRCFNCGVEGHWERDCTAGDWKDRCYRCGERGHIIRECKNSPKDLKRGRGYSRPPSPHGRSPSYGKSEPPSHWGGHGADREERHYSRRDGHSYSRSPRHYDLPSNQRNHSPRCYASPSNEREDDPRCYASSPNGRDRSLRGNASPPNGRNCNLTSNGKNPPPRGRDDQNGSRRRGDSDNLARDTRAGPSLQDL